MRTGRTTTTIKLDSRLPAVVVNGLVITDAPSLDELHVVLGDPSRVVSAGGPAPPGHRNNHIHVYDDLGVRLNEHHHTCRVQELVCSFACEEPLFPFSPHSSFAGELWIDEQRLPLGGPATPFVARCPIQLEHQLGGRWRWNRGDFHLGIDSRGPRLRSGRRSKKRRIVDVSLSWPHDPWADPPPGPGNTP